MTTAMHTRISSAPVMAVLPVVDVSRAKSFYRDTLGLEISEWPEASGYFVGSAGAGTSILFYERPVPTKAEHTVAGFSVDDLEATMAELRSAGVVFEEYDMPGLKTEHGVAVAGSMKSAWFRDTEGNILSISETH